MLKSRFSPLQTLFATKSDSGVAAHGVRGRGFAIQVLELNTPVANSDSLSFAMSFPHYVDPEWTEEIAGTLYY